MWSWSLELSTLNDSDYQALMVDLTVNCDLMRPMLSGIGKGRTVTEEEPLEPLVSMILLLLGFRMQEFSNPALSHTLMTAAHWNPQILEIRESKCLSNR
jgi:hypothetical protein